MTSITAICNIALSNIGKGDINDYSEASEEARQCRLHYPFVRDTALQSFEWSWAIKRQALAELSNTWTERFQFEYRRPTDCLKPLRIVSELADGRDHAEVEYSIKGTSILCSHPDAVLEYIENVEDPGRFPPLFREALCWALASKIALPLTKDREIRKDAYDAARQAMSAARVADANEVPTFWSQPSSLIDVRR
jgi:hypothetical protein